MDERRVPGVHPPHHPRQEHEGDPRPSGHERPAAEVARERVHRERREREPAEDHGVVREHLSGRALEERGRVVGDEPLEVERVALLPSERSARELVRRRPEDVVAALLAEPPEPADRAGRVVALVADERRPETPRERPGDEHGEARVDGERDPAFACHAAQPERERLRDQVAGACSQGRKRASDRELVRRDQCDTDRDVRPDDALERARDDGEEEDLHRHRRGDDPGVARLPAREVVAGEDVRDRVQAHRERERGQKRSGVREVRAEGRDDEALPGEDVARPRAAPRTLRQRAARGRGCRPSARRAPVAPRSAGTRRRGWSPEGRTPPARMPTRPRRSRCPRARSAPGRRARRRSSAPRPRSGPRRPGRGSGRTARATGGLARRRDGAARGRGGRRAPR